MTSSGRQSGTARRAWKEGLLFPGLISLAIIVYSVFPIQIGSGLVMLMGAMGIQADESLVRAAQIFFYLWLAGSLLVAYLAKWTAEHWGDGPWVPILLYLGDYGAFLSSVTVAAYVKEIQGAGLAWDKTIKTGRVAMPQ